MLELAREIVAKGLTVRDVEQRARSAAPSSSTRAPRKKSGKTDAGLNAELKRLQDELRRHLQTDVTITVGDSERGKIEIAFYSSDDLERVLDLVLAFSRAHLMIEDDGRGHRKDRRARLREIYTPHAGAMIIHVQRESGLANRTLIFTQRQVRLFRIGAIVLGSLIAFGTVSWFFLATQAARVPYLTRRVNQLQHDVSRVDTLQRSLNELAARFQQVQHMMGSASMPAAGDSLARSKTPLATPLATASLAAPATTASVAPIDSSTVPDAWPLPMAGTLLASSLPHSRLRCPSARPFVPPAQDDRRSRKRFGTR